MVVIWFGKGTIRTFQTSGAMLFQIAGFYILCPQPHKLGLVKIMFDSYHIVVIRFVIAFGIEAELQRP